MSERSLDDLQERLGYRFSDDMLLRRALTHSSLAASSKVGDLERLEFLGDRVLGLLTAEALWRRKPTLSEGEMAPRLNALVRKETCAKAAIALGLDELMWLSEQEESSGGRRKKAILGDVCEALLGALYVDGGLDAARKAYDAYWTPNLELLSKRHRDAKTTLQEWAQEKGRGMPAYKTLSADGPAHAPDFLVEVSVNGLKPAEGRGHSKRSAQMDAAKSVLMREGIWSHDD